MGLLLVYIMLGVLVIDNSRDRVYLLCMLYFLNIVIRGCFVISDGKRYL